MKPTTTAYVELQYLYEYFNCHLFNDELPNCLITLQREKKTYGYFSYQRFTNANNEHTDEIALNPSYFASCGLKEMMQTMVHEMCHLWQYHFGKAGRRGYHNKQWASKMISVGLMPSDTGKEGGKQTGDSMADYPIPNGIFEDHYNSLINSNFSITWLDRFPEIPLGSTEEAMEHIENLSIDSIKIPQEPQQNRSNRLKYTCPTCSMNLWGKPNLKIICGDCDENLTVTM